MVVRTAHEGQSAISLEGLDERPVENVIKKAGDDQLGRGVFSGIF